MLCSRNWACSIAPADRKKRVVKMESKHRKDDGFWLAVVTWIGGMASIITANFAYSRFRPSYHNPFFNDPVGMAIWFVIPNLFFWWGWWSRRRRM